MINVIYGLYIIAIMLLSFLIEFILSLSKKTTLLVVPSCIIFCILTIVVTLKFEIFIISSLTDISLFIILGIFGGAVILSYFFQYMANVLLYDCACIAFAMLFAVTGIIAVVSMYMLVQLPYTVYNIFW